MIPALEQAHAGNDPGAAPPIPARITASTTNSRARCSRVHVMHRGNVLPWLLASRALVHNGCTTAVEGYAMGVPAVAYLKTFDPQYDMDFQGLPNRLSLQCFNFDEL